MVASRALIINEGIKRQIADVDSLLVGSGIDAASGTLSVGSSTASAVTVGSASITTSFPGPVQFDGDVTTVGGTIFTTDATFEGNVTFGNANTDTVSFVSKVDSNIEFTGSPAQYQIKNMADPTDAQDAATKQYVDDALGSGAAGSNTEIQFNNGGAFGASANFSFDSATNIMALTGTLDLNGDLDMDGASVSMDASAAISLDAAAASNFSVAGADLTLSTTSSGNLVLAAAGAANMDAGGAISLDAAAASNFSVAGADLTLSTSSSGNLVLGAAGNIDADAVGMTLDASAAISLDAAAASNFSVAGADLTLSTTSSGNLVLAAAGAANMDAGGAISLDAAAASNFSVAGADLTLSTSSSGNLVLGAAGDAYMDAGGAISLDAAAASNFSVAGANLTLATTTSGTLSVDSAGALNLDAEANSEWRAQGATLSLYSTANVGWFDPVAVLSTTAAGDVNADGTNVNLKTGGTSRLVLNGTNIQVQSGATLGAASGGMIDLPSLFEINGTAVGASVTAPNLDDLTDGSAVESLHYHPFTAITSIPALEALDQGDVVCAEYNNPTYGCQKASAASGASARRNPIGVVNQAVAQFYGGPIIVAGLCPANFDSAPAGSDVGKAVYMSTTNGKVTLTAPTGSGEVVQRIGVLTNAEASPPVICVQIGDPYVLE